MLQANVPFPAPHTVSEAATPSCPDELSPQQYALPFVFNAQVWLPPTLTVCQSLCPSSLSTANCLDGAVLSLHPNAARKARALIAARQWRAREPEVKGVAGMTERKNTGLRAAIAFGVIAATIEMGIVLWMMYC